MIALLGATGKIGREIDKSLARLNPDWKIKKGYCRGVNAAENFYKVNIEDKESLKEFVHGCRLIINAAGPSEKLSEYVLQMALEEKIALIDVGNPPCYRNYIGQCEIPILHGCGAVPGVIGLLPLYLAKAIEGKSISNLIVNYSINEPMSKTAALDMVAAMNLTEGKNVVESKTTSVTFFGDAVYQYPYYDDESKGIDKKLNVGISSWNMIRNENGYEKILANGYKNKQDLAEAMCRYSKANQAGQENSVMFSVEISSGDGEQIERYRCFAKSKEPAELSGKTAASAAYILYEGIENGTSLMSLSKQAERIWEVLEGLNPFETVMVYPYGSEDMEEEGEL